MHGSRLPFPHAVLNFVSRTESILLSLKCIAKILEIPSVGYSNHRLNLEVNLIVKSDVLLSCTFDSVHQTMTHPRTCIALWAMLHNLTGLSTIAHYATRGLKSILCWRDWAVCSMDIFKILIQMVLRPKLKAALRSKIERPGTHDSLRKLMQSLWCCQDAVQLCQTAIWRSTHSSKLMIRIRIALVTLLSIAIYQWTLPFLLILNSSLELWRFNAIRQILWPTQKVLLVQTCGWVP